MCICGEAWRKLLSEGIKVVEREKEQGGTAGADGS